MTNLRLGGLPGVGAGLLCLALLPSIATAEIIDEEEVGRLTLNLWFGYSQTSMSEYNENISMVNHWLTHQPNSLREADDLEGSGTVRAELRYKIGERFSVGAGVGNAEAKSAFNVTFANVDFFTRSTVWSVMGYYHPWFVDDFGEIADRMNLYVGLGPVLLSHGYTSMRITDMSNEPFDVDGDLSELDGEGQARGSGSGFQGVAGASYQLNSRFSVAGELGYRMAGITDLELSNVEGYLREVPGDEEDKREPGDDAILDFFGRDRGAREARGIPDEDIEGNPIPYYSDFDGPLELDFSGFQASIALRIHIF